MPLCNTCGRMYQGMHQCPSASSSVLRLPAISPMGARRIPTTAITYKESYTYAGWEQRDSRRLDLGTCCSNGQEAKVYLLDNGCAYKVFGRDTSGGEGGYAGTAANEFRALHLLKISGLCPIPLGFGHSVRDGEEAQCCTIRMELLQGYRQMSSSDIAYFEENQEIFKKAFTELYDSLRTLKLRWDCSRGNIMLNRAARLVKFIDVKCAPAGVFEMPTLDRFRARCYQTIRQADASRFAKPSEFDRPPASSSDSSSDSDF